MDVKAQVANWNSLFPDKNGPQYVISSRAPETTDETVKRLNDEYNSLVSNGSERDVVFYETCWGISFRLAVFIFYFFIFY